MSTVNLREKVISKLESVDDYLLKEVLSLIEFETNEGLFKVSNSQKSAIDESILQIRNGESFTNEEVDNEIDTWLNK